MQTCRGMHRPTAGRCALHSSPLLKHPLSPPPFLPDGSLGDMLYFHTYKSSPRALALDIVADIRAMNDQALRAAPSKTGAIILGGGERAHVPRCIPWPIRAGCERARAPWCDPRAGVPKHHICNANLMRNGADFAVFLNTAQEFDGSDSGARRRLRPPPVLRPSLLWLQPADARPRPPPPCRRAARRGCELGQDSSRRAAGQGVLRREHRLPSAHLPDLSAPLGAAAGGAARPRAGAAAAAGSERTRCRLAARVRGADMCP